MTKTNSKDWRNIPTEKWNVNSIHAFLIDETRRRYNAEYKPGGRGSLSQRWVAEKGMIKREITKRGSGVVRNFIEVCWREYKTSNPRKFPYPTFGFMCGYMDRHWTGAERELESGLAVSRAKSINIESVDEGWF